MNIVEVDEMPEGMIIFTDNMMIVGTGKGDDD